MLVKIAKPTSYRYSMLVSFVFENNPYGTPFMLSMVKLALINVIFNAGSGCQDDARVLLHNHDSRQRQNQEAMHPHCILERIVCIFLGKIL